MIAQFMTPQFRRFLLTGGVAALVNLGSRVVYDSVASYQVAIVLAYATGMLTAYVLARRFVFVDASRDAAGSAPRFVIVNAVGMAQTWLVSVVMATHVLPALGVVRYVPGIAHAIGVSVPVFTSFVGHRLWTFRDASTDATAEIPVSRSSR